MPFRSGYLIVSTIDFFQGLLMGGRSQFHWSAANVDIPSLMITDDIRRVVFSINLIVYWVLMSFAVASIRLVRYCLQ